MDLFDVISFFENSDWVRVVVNNRGDENMISYKTTNQKSITINEETFKGYFEAVCHSDPEQYSMEMTEEVIREVERALAEQEQPIARIAHVF